MKEKQTPADRLRAYVIETRKGRGYTQEQCARRGEMPLSTWATVENAQRQTMPSAETLIAVAKGLGIPVLHLIRVIEGKPLTSDKGQLLGNLLADVDESTHALILEWLLMPPEERQAMTAAVAAASTVLRQRSREP